jgi:two-component sensor histidine kinase
MEPARNLRTGLDAQTTHDTTGTNAVANQATVNVLIVDDLAANRMALRAVLSDPGYTIIEAASSSAALRELLDREFAVLLLDVVMPDMDGIELAKLIRARDATRSVPILFVTAEADAPDLIERGYRAGAVDYLVKPLVPAIVCAKVGIFRDLYLKRIQIQAALHEKEILLREVHHRVKNNLQIISSLLNLQAARQPAEIRILFAEANARIRSIALVHEQLHLAQDLGALDVARYLDAVAAGLLQTYGSPRTHVEVKASPRTLSMDSAIPCGLIVNELVSNALRHAFPGDRPGKIEIRLTADNGGLELEVQDDGVGISPLVDVTHPGTMGLELVNALAHQLGGTFDVRRGTGTVARVRFPRPRLS